MRMGKKAEILAWVLIMPYSPVAGRKEHPTFWGELAARWDYLGRHFEVRDPTFCYGYENAT
jgi:hypothetical protein